MIIESKITPPGSLKSLARPRLMELVRESDLPLVIINAAAGYGKTTLMAQLYTRQTGFPVWYQLDARDQDPCVLISHLAAGLRQKIPGFGSQVDHDLNQVSDFGRQKEAILAGLANEIEEEATRPVVFFFDDFHVVNNNVLVTDSVRFLVTHLPEGSRTFIASREKPCLPLGRMRSQRAVLEIGREDLKFTLGEANGLLRSCSGSSFSDRQIQNLYSVTEGWPKALVLSSPALQGKEGAKGSETALRLAVADYVADEIWAGLDRPHQIFLMESSLLDPIDPEVCDLALNRSGSSSALLRSCEEQNLMMVNVGKGAAFRFHPLFREFLKQMLVKELGEARAKELHLRYAEAYEAQGSGEEAIEHFFRAGEPEQAAQVMDSCGVDVLESGRSQLMSGWLEKIPPSLFHGHPWLYFFQAQLEERQGKLSKALKTLDIAQRGFSQVRDRKGLYSISIARGEILMSIGEHQKGLRATADALGWSGASGERINVMNRLTIHHLLLGRTQKSLDLLAEAEGLCDKSMEQVKVSINAAKLNYLYYAGRFKEILGDKELLAGKISKSMPILDRLSENFYQSLVLFEMGCYQESLDQLAEGEELLDGEYRGFRQACRCLKGQNLLYTGDPDSGRKIIKEVFEKETEHKLLGPDCGLNCLGAFERQHGFPRQALEIHKRVLKMIHQEGRPYAIASTLVQIGADKIALGNGKDFCGKNELSEAFAIAKQSGYQYVKSQVHFFRAGLALRKGDHQKALAEINASVRLAARHSHTHFLVQEGRIALGLLSLAFESDFERGYLTEIFGRIGRGCLAVLNPFLSSSNAETRKAAVRTMGYVGGPQASARVRQMMRRDKDGGVRDVAKEALQRLCKEVESLQKVLTEREIQVVKMLSEGLSNRDIGARLFISEATVKTHVTRIFNKLGISKRSQVAKLWHRQEMEIEAAESEGGK